MAEVSLGTERTLKVVDCSRKKCKDGIHNVNSLKDLLELLRKGDDKLLDENVPFSQVRWFEEEDGTEFDDDDYLVELPSGTVLMACVEEQTWQPEFRRSKSQSSGSSQEDSQDVSGEESCAGFLGTAEPDGGRRSLGEVGATDEEQRQYATAISYLLNSKHAGEKRERAFGGVDEPDGRRQPGADKYLDDLEDGVHLMCDADPDLLASQLGVSVNAAEDLQLAGIVMLGKLQDKRDEMIRKAWEELEPEPALTAVA